MSFALVNSCLVCGTKHGLRRCQGCSVRSYCSGDHQVAHWPKHKDTCKELSKRKKKLDLEERKFRAKCGWAFEETVGRFWLLPESFPYLEARWEYAIRLVGLDSLDAVQTALGHFTGIIRLNRKDRLGACYMIPALLLRLGRNQDCWDYAVWHHPADTDYNRIVNVEDPNVSHMGQPNQDAFGSVDQFTIHHQNPDLSILIGVILVKIRLLFDLRNLRKSKLLEGKVDVKGVKIPKEIVDKIRVQMVSDMILRNSDRLSILDCEQSGHLIMKIKRQIDRLHQKIQTHYHLFWPALLNGKEHMYAKVDHWHPGAGNIQEIQVLLQNGNYHAWKDTPGALEFIEGLHKRYLKKLEFDAQDEYYKEPPL